MPPRSVETYLSPEAKQQMDDASALRMLKHNVQDWRGRRRLGMRPLPTRDEMMEDALAATADLYPDMPEEERQPIVEHVVNTRLADLETEQWAQQQASGEAVAKGAAATRDTIELTEEQQEALNNDKPWFRTRNQGIAQLARDTDDDRERFRIASGRLTADEERKLWDMQQEPQFFAPAGDGIWATIGNLGKRTAPFLGGLAEEMRKERQLAGNAVPAPGEDSLLGIPESAYGKPGLAEGWEKLKAFGSGTAETFLNPEKSWTLAEELATRKYNIQKQAEADAKAEIGEADPKLLAFRTEELTKERMANDSLIGKLLLDHPVITETLLGFADPGGLLIGKGLKAALPVAKAAGRLGWQVTPEAAREAIASSAPVQVASLIKDKFTYLPEVNRIGAALKEAGVEGADDAVSALRMRPLEALEETRKFKGAFTEKWRALRSAAKGLDPKELFRLLTLNKTREEVLAAAPEAYHKAININYEMADLAKEFEKRAGIDRKWSTWNPVGASASDPERLATEQAPEVYEFLTQQADRPNYTPTGLKIKPKKAKKPGQIVLNETTGEPDTSGMFLSERSGPTAEQASSAFGRKVSSEPSVPDVVEQWKHWAQTTISKGNYSLNLKLTDKVLQDHNLVQRVKIVGKSPEEAKAAIQSAIQSKSAENGLEFVALNIQGGHKRFGAGHLGHTGEGLGDIYQRVTGRVGEVVDDAWEAGLQRDHEVVILPKEAGKMLDGLRTFIEPESHGRGLEFAARKLNGLINTYMVPWKAFKTFLRAPAFVARNYLTSWGLASLTFGRGAANPALSAKAFWGGVLAADNSEGARAMASKIGVTLRNGEKVPMSDVLAAADRFGLTSQTGAQVGGSMGFPTAADAAQRVIENFSEGKFLRHIPIIGDAAESVARRVSPGYWAKASENYQHLMAFMGALEGMDEKSILRAADFASQWSGNYNMMGAWDRGIMRNSMAFYGWNRWITPHIFRVAIEHPDRFRNWINLNGGIEKYFSKGAGFFPVGETNQPPGKFGIGKHKPGSHEYAMAAIDNPVFAGLGLWPALAGAFFGGPTDDDAPANFVSPLAIMLIEMVTHRDARTGKEVKHWFDFSGIPQFQASAFGHLVMRPAVEWAKPYRDMMKLYEQAGRGDAMIDMGLRKAAGRSFLGLDHYIAPLFGQRGLSVGGMLAPQSGGIPGVWQYDERPLRTAVMRQRNALEGINARKLDLKNAAGLPGGESLYQGARDLFENAE